ncbi:MAG: tRNA preQ1(34) S-adenosylmethionine ribosyltransferase-isomerase QueA [Clostridiales bacterium]|nr:tRNA preQ1(34) S-adenosylmethionine ribosyltransferase-isomerase QueA [Clostridiales bacterium]
MKKSDFYYDLPQELIAQTPCEERDMSRMLCLGRESGKVSHALFCDIRSKLRPGDCLVVNESKVIPARLIGTVVNKPGSPVEVLLLKQLNDNTWECITRPGKKTRKGAQLVFGDGELFAEVKSVDKNGNRVISFSFEGIFMEILEKLGRVPLPPYITEELRDANRYQTVYSKTPGSAAAPTAGLHFTPELIKELEDMGVVIARLTLHIGLGTFRPVKVEDITEHVMHREWYDLPSDAAEKINLARERGGRIIAVGTTSCRTLESVASEQGKIVPASGDTGIFIYPGYKFKAIDGLITNFHLPESTLIMLVCAFAGYEHTMNAYKIAVEERYRFFSFGDCMFII